MQVVLRFGVVFVAGLLCLTPPAARSENADYSAGQDYLVKVWGADDGLTEGSVTDVAQTPEGCLWVGTLFGSVLRFDGIRFVSCNSANTPEFSQKWGVPRLMVDQGGTLWISMHDGGMTTWDPQGFRSVFISTNQPERLLWSAPGRVIFVYGGRQLLCGKKRGEQWDWETVSLPKALGQAQHCADAEGRVWYLRGSREIGLYDGGTLKTLSPVPGLEGQRIRALTADARGHVWAGTDQTLAEWQGDRFRRMVPTNGEGVLQVTRIVPSGGTSLWVEANGRMRRCAERQWVAESAGWNREMVALKSLHFLHGDAKAGLWSGAGDLGLIHVQADGTFHRLTTREGLPSNTIHFAYQDHDGNTWTGYERGGLVQIRPRLFQVIDKAEGLSDSLVNTVCEDTEGGVWIGTHSGRVDRYANGACTNLTLPADAHAEDSCVTADAQGRVWIGAHDLGLLVREHGDLRRVADAEQFQGYPRLMVPGRDGRLWVGTIWSIVSVFHGELTTVYTTQSTGDHPTGLAEANDGSIWAGTLAGLLLHWDGRQFVPLETPDRDSLGRIWALLPTADGGLWAGTEQGGLLHWRAGKFVRYTMKDGLPSDCVVQLLDDAQGNLWLGTRAGIARITRTAITRFERGELGQLPLSVYGQSDGLLTIGSAIIFQPNCWRGRDGRLFFAMANSIAAVNPEAVHVNPSPPTLALEALRVDGQGVWPTRPGALLTSLPAPGQDDSQAPPPRLEVGPGRGDLEFRYTGLSLSSPSRVRFKYKLEGLELAWNEAGTDRSAVYRHVPPGDYVFRVIGCNSDSVWNEEGAAMAVTVRPHFYQATWFRGGTGMLTATGLVLAVVATMRRRMHRRLEQLKRQHELERERSRIAQDLHDELGAGLTEIGLLGGLLQAPCGASENNDRALPRIVQRCRDLVTALDEIVWAVNPRNDSVNSLNGYLSRYAQGFLEPAAMRCRLDLQEAEPDHPFNSEQRHNLFLAFKEALTNVVKHSGAKEVSIRFLVEANERLVVCIEDDGRGLPQMVGEGADGLENLRQRMTRIGGQCDISNRPGGGVAVRLSLPLAAVHQKPQ